MDVRTDQQILEEIEHAWEDVQDSPDMELSPKTIDWLINKVKSQQEELDAWRSEGMI